jgi:hypothetical protein
MVLYLTKYSRPNIFNVMRELCNCPDFASMGTYLEILKMIKFFLDAKNFCLEFDQNLKIRTEIRAFSATTTRLEIQTK